MTYEKGSPPGDPFLRALGARFFTANGIELAAGDSELASLATVDLSELIDGALETTWRVAVDVTNPLMRPDGAAHVFGPQRGLRYPILRFWMLASPS